ncbi:MULTISPECIES: hypothetical protein [Kitasatospora]|uniref:Uncharacterized protein n=1 Tax=Kitasatospora setae (strain ATCC 33774 / DSM 43861 / JCM 3304 / KCC A-0304 / NBRC 14216 / KM-6054) TaxID=452652 RepID=E4NHW4_KITSK|nr:MULTISPECIES: hypothetical protein [Kitasatospora]BAJ31094.1 hypothetical protein KSE_53190 [Kitasatospora setae KM-6054]
MAYQTYSGQAPQPVEQRPVRVRPGFGLRGPRREKHVLTVEDLSALAFPVGDDGVVIGLDHQQQPAVIGLFRPSAFEVVLVGGMWTAQLIALRAAATGARIAVETGRPQAWAPMAQAAGGGQPCVTIHQVGRLGAQGASVASPVLVVRDLGARPNRSRLSAAPWQTTLTVLPYLGPNASRVLNAADLVGLQRVSPQEAELLGRLLSLSPGDVSALPTLPDNVTLWATRMRRQYVMTNQGEAETQVLGGPRRMD